MSHELEVAGLGSLGGLSTGDGHPVDPDRPCANCGGEVYDRYCTSCSQLATDFHRPFWDLILTSLGDTFAFDSRLWRSLPMLMLRPGRMTRNYLEGKRARYVPPFRMFLIGSVLFFLTIFTLGDQLGWYKDWRIDNQLGDGVAYSVDNEEASIPVTSDQQMEELRAELEDPDLSEEDRARLLAEIEAAENGISLTDLMLPDGRIDREVLRAALAEQMGPDVTEQQRETIWRQADHAATVFENQDRFGARIREWAPRFSLMFMPILALLLTVLYAWHRSRYIYDHVITSLHVQTFFYLLATLLVLIGAVVPTTLPWLIVFAVFIIPVYMYRQLRVTYGTGRFMSVLRTFILLFVGFIVLAILFGLLIAVSFYLV